MNPIIATHKKTRPISSLPSKPSGRARSAKTRKGPATSSLNSTEPSPPENLGGTPAQGHGTASTSPPNPPAKTVLLTVSGMSPAIITETVWKLAHPDDGKERVIPDEVVVITTTRGLSDINRELKNLDEQGKLKPRPGWGGKSVWQSLREAVLGAGASSDRRLQLSAPLIIELPNPQTGVKTPAEDIRTEADNIAAADFILERAVRGLVGNPEVRVIASIAGGRKTMGSLLYACMSLLARETDRVTHVLVRGPSGEKFDECRDFFFPDQPVQELVAGKEQQAIRATDARIELADIPFVPLINRFKDLGQVPGGFMGLVRTISEWLKHDAANAPEAEVRFDRANCRVWVNGLACDMEGLHAFDILRFVFLANEKGWVTHDNCREFSVAAEFFKASRGVKPDLSGPTHGTKKLEIHQPLANSIFEGFRDLAAADWIKDTNSHNVSSALSQLRAFLKRKQSRWFPPDRQWRLPPFRIIDG